MDEKFHGLLWGNSSNPQQPMWQMFPHKTSLTSLPKACSFSSADLLNSTVHDSHVYLCLNWPEEYGCHIVSYFKIIPALKHSFHFWYISIYLSTQSSCIIVYPCIIYPSAFIPFKFPPRHGRQPCPWSSTLVRSLGDEIEGCGLPHGTTTHPSCPHIPRKMLKDLLTAIQGR